MKIIFRDHKTTIHLSPTFQCKHHTVLTVNKQQLPEFERGTAFILKYRVVTPESESQFRFISPYPTLTKVNIEGVYDILR